MPKPHHMTNAEFSAFISNLPNNKEKMDTLLNGLPENIQTSAEYFLSLLADEAVTYIVLDQPRSVVVKLGGAYFRDKSSVNFIDSENYRRFVEEFIWPLTEVTDDFNKFGFEGFLNIPDPLGSSLPPLVARIHVLLPPVVDEPAVTILKLPRNK